MSKEQRHNVTEDEARDNRVVGLATALMGAVAGLWVGAVGASSSFVRSIITDDSSAVATHNALAAGAVTGAVAIGSLALANALSKK